ncbi:MAG: LytS/YhcK type 5TM receptor domain-containing protein [Clostridia bacterium]
MDRMFFLKLINNATLMLALSFIYTLLYINKKKTKLLALLWTGVLPGLIGIVIMMNSVEQHNGIIFDTRTIFIGTVGLFFGAIPVAVTAFMTILYRIIQGGLGIAPGILTILSSAAIGAFWHHFRFKKLLSSRRKWLEMYAMGLLIHVVMLLCMFSLPRDIAISVLRTISLPVLIIYPLGTLLLSQLLLWQHQYHDQSILLLESENRYRQLVSNAPDAIFVETDGKISFVNMQAVRMFGVSTEGDLLGKPIRDFIRSERNSLEKDVIFILDDERQPKHNVEGVIKRGDGIFLDVTFSISPFQYESRDALLIFVRDISSLKALEREKDEIKANLQQSQKLEAIGTLAGGVAHEINNPINGIINYAELILDTAEQESCRSHASEIIREGSRITEIVKSLLQFSRFDKKAHSYAMIEDIIHGTLSLMKTLMRHDNIILDVDIPSGLPPVKCRSQQIQQVLMNILTNSRDALNDRYPRDNMDKIISIRCLIITEQGEKWIRICVKDNGGGIPEELHERLFDPFFTTKPPDKGTGMGLSISHGIIKDHNGRLSFETVPGEYTMMMMDLPLEEDIV